MVVYAVRLNVRRDLHPAVLEWLPEHIREVLSSPGFVRAELLLDSNDAETPPAERVIQVLYVVESMESLERYLRERAPALRADGLGRFPEGFSATREIWPEVQTLTRT